MLDQLLKELIRFLESKIEKLDIVVMPDFFLDRLIDPHRNLVAFSKILGEVVKRKGGNIDDVKQTDVRGGNAVNTASALAALNMKVIPIVCTSKLGLERMKLYMKPHRIDLSHVKIFDRASTTTSIEFRDRNTKANVMLRDVGALAQFGPHHLNEEDFELIEKADYVCLFNWAGTKHFGTELAETVFSRVKTKGKGKTYYDTADPTTNEDKIPQLVKNVLQNDNVDILSVNESEAIIYASELTDEKSKLKKNLRLENLAEKSANSLASRLSARVDLHSTSFSATFTEKGRSIVPALNVPVSRITGAGDAWNAGNILGDAHGLSDELRLTLANAVAAYYISSPKAVHPTRKQLMEFCERLT